MHEATAVAAALNRGLAHRGTGTEPLTLLVRDPVRAEGGAVRFYARELLREQGLETIRMQVRTLRRRCSECGSWVRPSPTNPVCSRCEAPIPALPGPSVVASFSRFAWGSERCA
jgi:hypothetical protein